MTNSQISLNEYSNKYKVSVSTLRRRIKKQNVEFSFDQGKYFVLDKPLHEHTLPPRKVAQKDSAPPQNLNLSDASNELVDEQHVDNKNREIIKTSENLSEVSFAETANKLLEELKKAYMLILSEKEEQVLYLKEEIADLKTLVRVLENDNQELKASQLTELPDFDI